MEIYHVLFLIHVGNEVDNYLQIIAYYWFSHIQAQG